ncbi:hypothetical protein EYF80_026389 [Liparis tanakae]|uniref:Uncharacterized protein n=1 Tax=Liparis tanakae TaxID=230148 RepID=A0A4Z2HBV4_9TELE|nr:hypothetical protein EYF80_026389 [Liparis tanakae]
MCFLLENQPGSSNLTTAGRGEGPSGGPARSRGVIEQTTPQHERGGRAGNLPDYLRWDVSHSMPEVPPARFPPSLQRGGISAWRGSNDIRELTTFSTQLDMLIEKPRFKGKVHIRADGGTMQDGGPRSTEPYSDDSDLEPAERGSAPLHLQFTELQTRGRLDLAPGRHETLEIPPQPHGSPAVCAVAFLTISHIQASFGGATPLTVVARSPRPGGGYLRLRGSRRAVARAPRRKLRCHYLLSCVGGRKLADPPACHWGTSSHLLGGSGPRPWCQWHQQACGEVNWDDRTRHSSTTRGSEQRGQYKSEPTGKLDVYEKDYSAGHCEAVKSGPQKQMKLSDY